MCYFEHLLTEKRTELHQSIHFDALHAAFLGCYYLEALSLTNQSHGKKTEQSTEHASRHHGYLYWILGYSLHFEKQ